MINLVTKNPIVKKIVEGDANDEVLEMAVARSLPFTDEEYLESLVFVLKHDTFKSNALDRLKEIPDSTKLTYVDKRQANHRVAYFVLLEALNWKKPNIIAKIIKNQSLPHEFLLRIAEKGDESMLEMLLDNQIKLIAYPEIMDKMESNPEITRYIEGRIKEVRDYYLSQEPAEAIDADEVLDDVKELAAMEQENKKEDMPGEDENPEEEDEDLDMDGVEIEQKTLTLIQEINNMNISERIKLALIGSKTHRLILIKDPNKMVANAVVESPKISTDEVLLLARNKSIATDIIGKIARNREWVKNYPVMHELVQNPKTPIQEALGFVKKLYMKDLRMVTRNKNVNPVVRQLALKFLETKDRH